MKIRVLGKTAKDMMKATGKVPWLAERLAWRGNDETVTEIGLPNITPEAVDWLHKVLLASDHDGEQASGRIITTYLRVTKGAETEKTAQLKPMAEMMRTVIKKTKNKWMFVESDEKRMLPYFVCHVFYKPADKYNPARVVMLLRAMEHGKHFEKTVTWYTKDLRPKRRAGEAFLDKQLTLETPELVKEYKAQLQKYFGIRDLTGAQFSANGYAREMGSRDGYNIAMMRDGSPTRVVIDDMIIDTESDGDEDDARMSRERPYREEDSDAAPTGYWERNRTKSEPADDEEEEAVSFADEGDDDEDSEDGKGIATLPILPYVKVFDLSRHDFYRIHVDFLHEYKWASSLANSLVLHPDIKELIDILIEGASVQMEDIVVGKTGGVIVFSTGGPGIGKTLTAEVYSEEVKLPLYKVQCSQLGTDEVKLERRLAVVLQRATRWNCLLLIDEADVYVRERGTDIQQNAIVGVFLRVLEYYRGILFLTSNMATIIDDAIMSRATAHVEYEVPTPTELIEIWRVLLKNYGVATDDEDAREFAEALPGISGRNVKHLIKLARMFSARKSIPIDVDLIKKVSKFVDLSSAKPAELEA